MQHEGRSSNEDGVMEEEEDDDDESRHLSPSSVLRKNNYTSSSRPSQDGVAATTETVVPTIDSRSSVQLTQRDAGNNDDGGHDDDGDDDEHDDDVAMFQDDDDDDDSRFQRRTEFVACLALFAFAMIFSYVIPWPALKERPIPVQVISLENDDDNNGDASSGASSVIFYIKYLALDEVFRGDTVSTTALVLLTGPLPAAIQYGLSYCWNVRMITINFSNHPSNESNHHSPSLDANNTNGSARTAKKTAAMILDRHNTLCAYFFSKAVETIIMETIKVYCGYLRPVFYQLCQPNETYEYCTNDDDDARKSFPSGHASQAFSGLFLLTLYIDTTFGITRLKRLSQQQRRQRPYHPLPFAMRRRARLLSVLALLPTLLALWIAVSRIVDNKHWPADVVGGIGLGMAVATWSHHLWFSLDTV